MQVQDGNSKRPRQKSSRSTTKDRVMVVGAAGKRASQDNADDVHTSAQKKRKSDAD